MTAQPFHHGNLRAVLLAEAERSLRLDGVDALSLRNLARRAGVSHGAPRRHFPDRRSLLDALAEIGFQRLTVSLREVLASDDPDYRKRFHALAHAYVEFAINDSALMELMFAAKNTTPAAGVHEAAEGFFRSVNDVLDQGHEQGLLTLDDPYRLQMLLVATLQGIATLVASGRLPAAQIESLIADATAMFVRPGTGT